MKATLLPIIGAAAMLVPAAAFAQSTSATTSPTTATSATTSASSTNNSTASQTPEAVTQRIQQLHQQLEITPAQQSQWSQFTQVMRQNAQDMRNAIDQRGAAMNTMSAVQNMQSYTQLAETHAQDMQRLSTAFDTLYKSMSPKQQQNADQVFRYKAQAAEAKHGRSAG